MIAMTEHNSKATAPWNVHSITYQQHLAQLKIAVLHRKLHGSSGA